MKKTDRPLSKNMDKDPERSIKDMQSLIYKVKKKQNYTKWQIVIKRYLYVHANTELLAIGLVIHTEITVDSSIFDIPIFMD